MQQDSFKDFDRVVRSACEGAAEEVPSSVWRAVAARLDAAAPVMAGSARPFAAPRSYRFAWVAGLAMAAAIALGVFFLGTRDRNSDLNIVSGSALTAEVVEAEPVAEEAVEAPAAAQDATASVAALPGLLKKSAFVEAPTADASLQGAAQAPAVPSPESSAPDSSVEAPLSLLKKSAFVEEIGRAHV